MGRQMALTPHHPTDVAGTPVHNRCTCRAICVCSAMILHRATRRDTLACYGMFGWQRRLCSSE